MEIQNQPNCIKSHYWLKAILTIHTKIPMDDYGIKMKNQAFNKLKQKIRTNAT